MYMQMATSVAYKRTMASSSALTEARLRWLQAGVSPCCGVSSVLSCMEVVKAAKMGRCISFIDVIVSLAPCASTIQTLTTLCLLGKIVTPKLVEEAAVKEFVRSVWKRPTSVTIFLDVTTKSTMYKFGFKKEEDMRWVLENGSWCSIVKVDLDEKKPASWSQWLRVRIDHDVEKPLYSGYFINLSNGTKKWIQYKYEKLGIFCFHCGCLGHQWRG
ncbi:hypothetical protein F8388_001662 [Cannabis sativa]|uniref:Zinc knuckle CX2CX4HX4C domain-containing protein n=1 Tax=Cannabis sativa TaxID=3483 RepID=A0A7J6HJQ0_CANSA|nr:hypothetical protein F8388_001662 [Cannabis sativa]